MKRFLPICMLAATAILSFQLTSGAEAPTKEVEVRVRWLKGDPLGSPKAKTVSVLLEPVLVSSVNRPFSFVSGQVSVPGSRASVEIGTKVSGQVGAPKNGKAEVDLTVAYSNLREKTDGGTFVHTESIRLVSKVTLGQVERLSLANRAPNDQEWIEIRIEEVKSEPVKP